MKLNLGSGSKKIEGYINLDKYNTFKPDIVHDLEKFPYPFENDSVTHILLSHVLEHLGQNPDVFNSIIKELYRICVNKAFIDIRVPHPRHDDFIAAKFDAVKTFDDNVFRNKHIKDLLKILKRFFKVSYKFVDLGDINSKYYAIHLKKN